jgi:CheY-like chemotaxis protein
MILMDIRLPDISGFEALTILQADPTTAGIPVIAVSSDCYPLQISKGLQAGFYRYLTKPYKLDDLTKAIDDALRHGPKLMPSDSAPNELPTPHVLHAEPTLLL